MEKRSKSKYKKKHKKNIKNLIILINNKLELSKNKKYINT